MRKRKWQEASKKSEEDSSSEGEEEDAGRGLVACNLRPLKTRWETARLLCLNGTGDGMCRTGRNVEGSRGWTRNVRVTPGKGEVLAPQPRHATWNHWVGLSTTEFLVRKLSGTVFEERVTVSRVVAWSLLILRRTLGALASPVLWTYSTGCRLITGCSSCGDWIYNRPD